MKENLQYTRAFHQFTFRTYVYSDLTIALFTYARTHTHTQRTDESTHIHPRIRIHTPHTLDAYATILSNSPLCEKEFTTFSAAFALR